MAESISGGWIIRRTYVERAVAQNGRRTGGSKGNTKRGNKGIIFLS